MSDLVTDEMVEAAARAGIEYVWTGDEAEKADTATVMRRILESVAPLIASAALRAEADRLARMDDGGTGGYHEAGRHIIARIRECADQIEKEEARGEE